jgi:hypothetical protein
MKSLLRLGLFMLGAFLISNTAIGQDKSKRASPPAAIRATINDASVVVQYSSPFAKGRAIWGDLVPYGKIWRAGANEATTFETDKKLTVGDQSLPAGKYSIFLIPNEGEWTFVFNSISDQWGAYQYDEKKDVIRVNASPSKMDENIDKLTYKIEDGKLWLMWADQMAGVSLQ